MRWICVSVRVGEYFGAMCGKKTLRQICRQRQMPQWSWMPLFTLRNILIHLSHTSLLLPIGVVPASEEISNTSSLSSRTTKAGETTRKVLKHIPSGIVSICHCQMYWDNNHCRCLLHALWALFYSYVPYNTVNHHLKTQDGFFLFCFSAFKRIAVSAPRTYPQEHVLVCWCYWMSDWSVSLRFSTL